MLLYNPTVTTSSIYYFSVIPQNNSNITGVSVSASNTGASYLYAVKV